MEMLKNSVQLLINVLLRETLLRQTNEIVLVFLVAILTCI